MLVESVFLANSAWSLLLCFTGEMSELKQWPYLCNVLNSEMGKAAAWSIGHTFISFHATPEASRHHATFEEQTFSLYSAWDAKHFLPLYSDSRRILAVFSNSENCTYKVRIQKRDFLIFLAMCCQYAHSQFINLSPSLTNPYYFLELLEFKESRR